jgi:ABC-type multidrug transport system permease subunit
MTALGAVLYREGKIRATNLTFIFWDVFYPLGYLLVFGVGMTHAVGGDLPGGLDYNAFFLAGVLGMASFGIASNTAWSFFMDRDNGIFYEMLTYPLSRSEYLIGCSVCLCASICCRCSSPCRRSPRRFNTVTSIFYFVFLFASSMFYPLEPLPEVFRRVAYANPITWQVDVLRYATVGIGEPRVLVIEAAAFLVFTAATFFAALWSLHRQE